MKLTNPKKTPSLKAAESFIAGAEQDSVAVSSEVSKSHPWEGLDPRNSQAFNLRLPEDLHAKLQYLADNTPRKV